MTKSFEQECKGLKIQVSELEKKLEGVIKELAVSESTLAIRNADFAALQNNLKEIEELREMKEVFVFFFLKKRKKYFFYLEVCSLGAGVRYKFTIIVEGNLMFISLLHRIH